MLVTEAMVQAAFDWLNENAEKSAAAKANRVRAEHRLKRAKAEAFNDATGTMAEREHKAIASPGYDAAVELEIEAVEVDEFHKNQRSKCVSIIEAWRTEQSNYRAMGKVA